jgi:hypothetical protein
MMECENGKIYKIISPHTHKIYIGSTVEKYLCDRLTKHKYNNKMGTKCSSKYIMDLGEHKIVLIERYPCDTTEELRAREQVYLDKEEAICVNENKAYTGLSVAEYQAQYQAKYRAHLRSWGDDPKSNNNLLKIDVNLFK